MIPIEYGERKDTIFLSHDNGMVAIQGEYQWDAGGRWTEYYANGKRKKIVTYPKEAFDDSM